MNRRQFLKNGAKATSLAVLGFPNIIKAYNQNPTIKVVGTHVTLQETIRLKAQKELGINIEFYPEGSAKVLLKAATDPSSFDIYEQWSNSIKILWQANTLKAIDINKIKYWDEINNLTKKGRITPNAKIGLGDYPNKLLYIQDDNSLGSKESKKVSFLPYVHNTDSFGYDSRYIKKGIPYETESWSWLLDEKNRGKVGVINAPTIGLFDLALAVKAKGYMNFKDMGNMSKYELDELFKIIIKKKREGHFRGFWTSVPHSVKFMSKNEVTIQSMFSPGVSMLKAMDIPCIYAAPKEGYRAWHGVMCLSKETKGEKEEAAYAFMNWWLSGWAGAFVARQGYYISNPQRSKKYMTKEEWDYWYEGKVAAKPLRGTDGKITVKEGEIRSGGSYTKRFENIAIWNSVMDNYEYSLQKWNEFVLA